jgi:pimeloyl-ACP methyl ester carboxylesterase
MGWAGNAATWQPQLDGLARHFRVIAFDNRGSGRSSTPQGPYSTFDMAADAVGLLDALGVEKSHVFGVSMGGMIAQELALTNPERVRTLVLGCTTAGGSAAAGINKLRVEIEDFQHGLNELPSLEWFLDFMRRLWTPLAMAQAPPEMQDFVLSIIRHPPSAAGLRHQAGAIAAHDAFGRLPAVKQPTLVLTGTDDLLIDPLNSMILADRLPKAEVRSFSGLRHAFHLEQPRLVNSVIVDFVKRHEEHG